MSSHPQFNVHVEEGDATLRATVVGELDLLTEPQLVAAFTQALDGTDATSSILDLRQLAFIDSSGLRALLLCRRHAAQRCVALSLQVAQGPLTRLLEVAGVRDWFTYV